jgi:2Fe-2S ferredoxin
MAKVTFIEASGTTREGTAETGTVMALAVAIGVRGIEGQCGGSISCGTCHVRVAPEWLDRAGRPSAFEQDLLEFEEGVSDHSRLSCQIAITPEIDGLTVTVMGK